MLRALICINMNIIDTLCMWNQCVTDKRGRCKYLVWLKSEECVNPGDGVRISYQRDVWHKREDGWQVLLMKSLKALKK